MNDPALEACLPAALRGPDTTITRIAAGLSGAGVHRVEAGGQAFVLKVAAADAPLADWRRRLHVQRQAGDAGLAPRVVHADEARRAIVTAFAGGGSFLARLGDPRTRDAALVELGRTVRGVHALPIPPDAVTADPRAQLATVWSSLPDGFAPAFVAGAVRRVLDEEPPASDRALVLAHNDVNPSNLALDGERLVLLDWDTAAPNDPFYDLAAIAVFLRLDGESCAALLSAYDDAPVAALPARFTYDRRMIAALCGAVGLTLARASGHANADGETLDATPSLVDFYQRLRSGALSLATSDGQWWFALALVKTSLAL